MKKFFTLRKNLINFQNIKRFSSEVPPVNETKKEEIKVEKISIFRKFKNIFYLQSEKLHPNTELIKKLRVSR